MRPGIWLDENLASADWTPPVSKFRTPRWARVLLGALVVALVVGLVVGLGGFERRADDLVARRPGAILETGPFEITLHRVTAQRVQDWDEEWVWELRLQGTIRNVWSESAAYQLGEYGWMAWRQPGSQEVVIPQSLSTVHSDTFRIPPSGDLYAVEWTGQGEQPPAAYLEVHMLDLEYTDNSLLGFGTRVWNPGNFHYQTWVPVIRLPDKSYS